MVSPPGAEAAIVNRLDALEIEIGQPFGLVAIGCRRMAISKILLGNRAGCTINAGNEQCGAPGAYSVPLAGGSVVGHISGARGRELVVKQGRLRESRGDVRSSVARGACGRKRKCGLVRRMVRWHGPEM